MKQKTQTEIKEIKQIGLDIVIALIIIVFIFGFMLGFIVN
jgi:hypothetical protein